MKAVAKDRSEIVRIGIEEVAALLPLILHEGAEIGINPEKVNKDKVLRHLEYCAGEGVVFASYEGGYTGFIALYPVESFWDDRITLASLAYYVEPEHRGAAGLDLLRTARDFGRRAGTEINIYTDTDADRERKDAMFDRLGFERRGGIYKLRVQ